MALDREDLKEIKKIVDGAIEKSEAKISDKVEFAIEKSELRIEGKIEKSKKEIIAATDKKIESAKEETVERVNREVSDLSDINRAVIVRHDELDYRLKIVERKLGIR